MTVRIHAGDCRDVLATLPAGSVHTVCTSPPYLGLRRYLPDGHKDAAREIGSEPTPDEYVAAMVDVMREVKRVLRDDGVAWVVLGDSYGGYHGNARVPDDEAPSNKPGYVENMRGSLAAQNGNLLMIPARLALALQADGWTLRQIVQWCKPAPLPESVAGTRWERCRTKVKPKGTPVGLVDRRPHSGETFTDPTEWATCPGCPKCSATDGYVLRRGSWRHTSATEVVFMLTKGMAYWADQEAVRERLTDASVSRLAQDVPSQAGSTRANGGAKTNGPMRAVGDVSAGRNPRNWVTPSPSPFSGAHFATFVPGLIEPFIRATCPARCCPTCGAGWAPVVERTTMQVAPSPNRQAAHDAGLGGGRTATSGTMTAPPTSTVLGYRPTCQCGRTDWRPGVCLDPFFGAGTTGLVADRLGLDCIGIELNESYVQMAADRIRSSAPLLASVEVIDGASE